MFMSYSTTCGQNIWCVHINKEFVSEAMDGNITGSRDSVSYVLIVVIIFCYLNCKLMQGPQRNGNIKNYKDNKLPFIFIVFRSILRDNLFDGQSCVADVFSCSMFI